jgi:hypothetical protein
VTDNDDDDDDDNNNNNNDLVAIPDSYSANAFEFYRQG